VAARQKNLLATSFHPELTRDGRVHEMFVEGVHAETSRRVDVTG
jgi:pyridoxal 5'-phosphate synthase pdxT subunit